MGSAKICPYQIRAAFWPVAEQPPPLGSCGCSLGALRKGRTRAGTQVSGSAVSPPGGCPTQSCALRCLPGPVLGYGSDLSFPMGISGGIAVPHYWLHSVYPRSDLDDSKAVSDLEAGP